MTLTIAQIRNLLVSAFEGGSNYWYQIPAAGPKDAILGPKHAPQDFRKGGKAQPKGDYYHWSELIPTTPDCALLVTAPEGFGDYDWPVVLNIAALRHGAQVMYTKYPQHYANVLAENDDAETGDVFLQCALFGEVVFG